MQSDRRVRTAQLVLAFAAVYVLWGSTYLAIRVAVASLPPFLLAGVRFRRAARLCGAAAAHSAARNGGEVGR